MPPVFEGFFPVLFVSDLARAREFYETTLGCRFDTGDDGSAGIFIGDDFFLLRHHDGADEMLGSGGVDHESSRGARQFLVAPVTDVDATYNELRSNGVEFIRAPEDREWGMRVAYFSDPDGNVWEIRTPMT
jgi:lactoylglutathione lyase